MKTRKNVITIDITEENMKILNSYTAHYGTPKRWFINKAIEGFAMVASGELEAFAKSISNFKSPLLNKAQDK